jgi:PAS domain-containing protein
MVLGYRKKEIAGLKQQISDLEAEVNRLRKAVKETSIENNPCYNLPVLSRILDINGTGILTCTGEKNVVWLSQTAKEIMGYKGDSNITFEQLKN